MERARIPYVTGSVADGLRKLVELREQGVLNGEEFEAAKAEMFPVHPTWLRDELRKLAELHGEGVLSDEELEAAKSQVTAMPPDMLNIPAGDSHVVYVIPDFLLARMANSDSEFRRRSDK